MEDVIVKSILGDHVHNNEHSQSIIEQDKGHSRKAEMPTRRKAATNERSKKASMISSGLVSNLTNPQRRILLILMDC